MSTGARTSPKPTGREFNDAIRTAEATTAGEIYVVVANEAAEFADLFRCSGPRSLRSLSHGRFTC